MPLFKRMSITSWSKRASKKSTKKEILQQKKTKSVQIDIWPQYIESDYEMTDELQAELWYSRKTLVRMSVKADMMAARIARGKMAVDSSDEDEEDCQRGLEAHIRDKACLIARLPTRSDRHRQFIEGLLKVQKEAPNALRQEQIREYCQASSTKQEEDAAKLARKDALAALQVYEAPDNTVQQQQPAAIHKSLNYQSSSSSRKILSHGSTQPRAAGCRAA
ncbi:expressed unknown protein [Seminavis robusta]|uniref:Uncharacterized protein n=1 Tax=Seminavis robusta TaxID=568900 RepID=A0A9N8E952_9STRA|nr:expressed unknown protein [Seminavis robusta]|eukprot:Sro686_g187100.1 n/a (220) ;mRNA; r:31973-32632